MAVLTYTTTISNADDAGFRAWGSELSAALAGTGLVRTADTGQINWTSVTRPAVNTAGGYEIWRFDDAMQGTAPIFIKLEFGCGSNLLFPQIWIAVGTGSNGSGELTGSTATRASAALDLGIVTSSYPTYLCVAPGFFGLLWKSGASSGSGQAFLAVGRTADAAGDSTAAGFVVYAAQASLTLLPLAQCVRTASPAAEYPRSTLYTLVPHQVASSALTNGDVQAYAHFGIDPAMWTLPWIATVVLADIPAQTTFNVAMVGSTARTYLSLGSGYRPVNTGTGPGSATSYGFAMLWE